MNVRLTLVAGTVLLLAACSGKADNTEQAATPPSAMGKDFALTSQSIDLPSDDAETFPVGPNVETMETSCRACHSPSMILTQPPLTHAEWAKEVDKMRNTFKAVVSDEDVPKILEYLDDYSANHAADTAPAVGAPKG